MAEQQAQSSFDWTWVVVALLVVAGLLGAVWLYNYGQAQQAQAYGDAVSESTQQVEDSTSALEQAISDLEAAVQGIGPDSDAAAPAPETPEPAAPTPEAETGGEGTESGE